MTLFLLLMLTVHAGAAPPVEETPQANPAPSRLFKEQLEGAKKLYFQGKREEAKDLLSELQVRYLLEPQAVPWELAAEALVYLGEVYYFVEDLDRAGTTWRLLLEKDPDYAPLSPFAHPPEVVGEFERLRAIVRSEIAARPVPEPPPVPAWTALPLGVPQFIDGRPVRGLSYGLLQVGFAAGSIGMWTHLRSRNLTDSPHPLDWTEEQQARRVNVQRYALQWPMTAAFYGSWIASHADARAEWHRSHEIDASIGWAPGPNGHLRVRIAGRF